MPDTSEHLAEPGGLTRGYLRSLDLEAGEPTFALLAQIIRGHVARFPFSSVGVRLGDALPLTPERLFERIVERGRGGYCFEHNGLVFEVLSDLGYDVTVRLARVINNGDHLPGLTHRIAHVRFDDVTYVVDVGFGAAGPRFPVRMPPSTTEESPWPEGEEHRVVERRPGEFHLQHQRHGEPFSLYRFDLGVYGQADCELGHFFSHRHPDAVFVNNLVASRILDDEIRSLRNRDYRVIRADGEVDVSVTDADQLIALLRQDFGLRITDDEGQRLFAGLLA